MVEGGGGGGGVGKLRPSSRFGSFAPLQGVRVACLAGFVTAHCPSTLLWGGPSHHSFTPAHPRARVRVLAGLGTAPIALRARPARPIQTTASTTTTTTQTVSLLLATLASAFGLVSSRVCRFDLSLLIPPLPPLYLRDPAHAVLKETGGTLGVSPFTTANARG